MNLTPKARKIAETVIETVFGLAAATPVLLTSTGVGTKVGAGATLLAVSVVVTNLTSVPFVERLLDRFLGNGSSAQLVSLAQEIQDVEQVMAEHVATHGAPADPSSPAASAVVESAPAATAISLAPVTPESTSQASAAGGTPPTGPAVP